MWGQPPSAVRRAKLGSFIGAANTSSANISAANRDLIHLLRIAGSKLSQ
jgi:hypothetical protein